MSLPLTFESLVRRFRCELDALFSRGEKPSLEALAGWEFRGWNRAPVTGPLKLRRFRKGFEPKPGKGEDAGFPGYNVLVRAGGLQDPWSDSSLIRGRRLRFRLRERRVGEPHENALVIDYGGWRRHALDPVRLVRDHVTLPDRANRDLLLGKAYLQVGERHLFLEHFVLERYRRIEG